METVSTDLSLLTLENQGSFIIWPYAGAKERQLVLDRLKQHSDGVEHFQTIRLTRKALGALLACTYLGHPWLGSASDRYRGARKLARKYFRHGSHLTFIVVRTRNSLILKERLREGFEEPNRIVHGTDTDAESRYLIHHFLNANFLDLLKNGHPLYSKTFLAQIEALTERAPNSEVIDSSLLVVGSSTLAVYGIRKPKDLDVLHSKTFSDHTQSTIKDDHTEFLEYYPASTEEMLSNSSYNFPFLGYRFAALHTLLFTDYLWPERKKNIDATLITLHKILPLGIVRFIGLILHFPWKLRLFIAHRRHSPWQ